MCGDVGEGLGLFEEELDWVRVCLGGLEEIIGN
jgi:hypothetical protein